MRVIAGSAKSMPLKTIPGLETRPTTDRVKETLFNMLQPYLCECRFLDIFAGSGGADVWCKDIFQAVAFLENEEPFDCIFMDPPYNQELEKQVLEFLRDVKFVNEDTRIIVEASLETDFSYLEELGFSIDKIKRYKTNQHIFIRKA